MMCNLPRSGSKLSGALTDPDSTTLEKTPIVQATATAGQWQSMGLSAGSLGITQEKPRSSTEHPLSSLRRNGTNPLSHYSKHMNPVYIEIDENGNKYYYKDKAMKTLHREDGAAVEWSNGYKAWLLNGHLHREDGHAVEYSDGSKVWCLNGVKYTEEEFKKKTAKEIVLTLDEIAAKFGIGEGAKLVIVKGASGVGMTMQEAWG